MIQRYDMIRYDTIYGRKCSNAIFMLFCFAYTCSSGMPPPTAASTSKESSNKKSTKANEPPKHSAGKLVLRVRGIGLRHLIMTHLMFISSNQVSRIVCFSYLLPYYDDIQANQQRQVRSKCLVSYFYRVPVPPRPPRVLT